MGTKLKFARTKPADKENNTRPADKENSGATEQMQERDWATTTIPHGYKQVGLIRP